MKVTKLQVKEIIRENIESLPIDNLIAGISGLVQDMDPELVGVVFTTVFKDIEGAPAAGEEGDELPQSIGFDREPEEGSIGEPTRIGFEENIQRIIIEEITSDDALMGAINRLTNKIESLDVSVDYLASAVTGEDPVALGFGQSALGRGARVKKRAPAELAEIIEQEIEEALDTSRMAPVARTLSRAGIAQRSEPTRAELIKLIAGLDTGDPEELQQLADMVAQLIDAADENIEQGYGLEEDI
tara:strand:- start:1347 stop:2075 length:729 start_codon:yes stop_codon:yes gene_type:complete